jgi:murein DD-endopeptidase MepM/ murein hydrolase activator NlpD
VLDLSGTVLLARAGQAERALRKGEALLPGDRAKVREASSLILADAGSLYLLRSHSSVKIERVPVLVYGTMQKTASGRSPERSSEWTSEELDPAVQTGSSRTEGPQASAERLSAPRLPGSEFDEIPFSITPRPAQGRTVKVLLRSNNALRISASISDGKKYTVPLRFFPAGDGVYRALVGFDVEAKTGRYMLSVRAEGQAGDVTEIRRPFMLAPSTFERGKVYLPSDTLELLEPSKMKTEERETLSRILSNVGEEALWNFTFRPPVDRIAVLSAFGKVRLYYTNGKPAFSRSHRGIDLEGERGDYVIAPNSGVVVFSGMRITTGNTIVIDHGQGVFSLLFHLDTLYERAGAYVVKGQRIGEIGATGIAEGAHLHWGMFVNGAYVDPLDWLKRAF